MGLEAHVVFGVIIGIVSYILLYLGKGVQKYAIEGLKEEGKLIIKNKHSRVWIFGTGLHILYMFVHWAALLLAPIHMIAPLEGLGLIILVLFSYYVLKEEISGFQVVGLFFIIAGTVLITLFNTNTGHIVYTDFNSENFLIATISILSIEIVAIIISKRTGYKAAGFIIGSNAGTFMAFQTVMKRITAIPDLRITLIFAPLTFLAAFLTFAMTQLALAKAKANLVVPSFTSASITLAVLIGFFTLNERISIVQIFGILIIIFGVIFLNLFKKGLSVETSSS